MMRSGAQSANQVALSKGVGNGLELLLPLAFGLCPVGSKAANAGGGLLLPSETIGSERGGVGQSGDEEAGGD